MEQFSQHLDTQEARFTQTIVPPRIDLQRFDRTEVIEWLEDYEYFFEVHSTPEAYKVKTVIPYLVVDARE
jgi:hypothetical protein